MANYSLEKQRSQLIKLKQLCANLPPMCAEFFRGIEQYTQIQTRIAYAVDLKTFFNYMQTLPWLDKNTTKEINLDDIKKLNVTDIECYLQYLTLYDTDNQTFTYRENANTGKARKLSTLRAFIKYFVKKQLLDVNVAALVDAPKLKEQAKIRLEANEVANLLDTAEFGENLTKKQLQYHNITAIRDTAMLSLFLGTGIRINELISIDLDDINLADNAFRVTRKGGDTEILYFNEEVARSLEAYLEKRLEQIPLKGHEKALFLSIQNRRITARAVQNFVKKYSKVAVPLKEITPHKLRKTYGTMLYLETGDIYLVANALGHKDINTTRKHYADTEEQNKRLAARTIKLRDN